MVVKRRELHVLGSPKFRSGKPVGMSRMPNSENSGKEDALFQKQAISIFTDCSNAGLSFQDSLAAILRSGFHWGVEISKEAKSCK